MFLDKKLGLVKRYKLELCINFGLFNILFCNRIYLRSVISHGLWLHIRRSLGITISLNLCNLLYFTSVLSRFADIFENFLFILALFVNILILLIFIF